MPEKEICKIFSWLGLNIKNGNYRFNKKLFDDIGYELGNDHDSYIEGIVFINGRVYFNVYFNVYITGDSTDDNIYISYDDFAKTSGNVEINSKMAREIAVYDKDDRLRILNLIGEICSDAVDGNDIFF